MKGEQARTATGPQAEKGWGADGWACHAMTGKSRD